MPFSYIKIKKKKELGFAWFGLSYKLPLLLSSWHYLNFPLNVILKVWTASQLLQNPTRFLSSLLTIFINFKIIGVLMFNIFQFITPNQSMGVTE